MATAQDTSAPAQKLPHALLDQLFDVHCNLSNIESELRFIKDHFNEGDADSEEEKICGVLRILIPYVGAVNEKLYRIQTNWKFESAPQQEEGDDNE